SASLISARNRARPGKRAASGDLGDRWMLAATPCDDDGDGLRRDGFVNERVQRGGCDASSVSFNRMNRFFAILHAISLSDANDRAHRLSLRTTSTDRVAVASTRDATLPSMPDEPPRQPCAPTTMRSAPTSAATL